MFGSSGINANCLLASIGLSFIDILLILMSPESIGIIPVVIFSVVDLPAPFGPKNPNISLSLISKEILSTAVKDPYFLVTFVIFIMIASHDYNKIITFKNACVKIRRVFIKKY